MSNMSNRDLSTFNRELPDRDNGDASSNVRSAVFTAKGTRTISFDMGMHLMLGAAVAEKKMLKRSNSISGNKGLPTAAGSGGGGSGPSAAHCYWSPQPNKKLLRGGDALDAGHTAGGVGVDWPQETERKVAANSGGMSRMQDEMLSSERRIIAEVCRRQEALEGKLDRLIAALAQGQASSHGAGQAVYYENLTPPSSGQHSVAGGDVRRIDVFGSAASSVLQAGWRVPPSPLVNRASEPRDGLAVPEQHGADPSTDATRRCRSLSNESSQSDVESGTLSRDSGGTGGVQTA